MIFFLFDPVKQEYYTGVGVRAEKLRWAARFGWDLTPPARIDQYDWYQNGRDACEGLAE